MRAGCPSSTLSHVLPLSDGIKGSSLPDRDRRDHRGDFAVWLFYELPHLGVSVNHASFYPCTVDGSCHGPLPLGDQLGDGNVHARQLGSHPWQHVVPGRLRQERRGRVRADPLPPVLLRRWFGCHVRPDGDDVALRDAGRCARAEPRRQRRDRCRPRRLLRSLYPRSTVFGLIGIFPVRISAWFFLGFWFLYQLFEANFGLLNARAHGGGVAFFAHVGGFVFGFLATRLLVAGGRSGARSEPALRAYG